MKKILSLLLIAILLISIMPSIGLAETKEVHQCESCLDIASNTWVVFEGNEGNITTNKNFVLTTDTTLTETFKIGSNVTVNICLNGYALNTGEKRINNYGGTLNIYSCIERDHYFVYSSNNSLTATTTSMDAKTLSSDTQLNDGDIVKINKGCIYSSILKDNLINNNVSLRINNIMAFSQTYSAVENWGIATITNCDFVGSYLTHNQAFGAINNLSKMSLDKCNFYYNRGNDGGGAIYNGKNGSLDIKDSVFAFNSTKNNGGAIYNLGTLNLDKTKFRGNSGSNGGAIFNNSDKLLDIKESVFENNKTNYGGYGGAICNNGTINVDKTYFLENYGNYGGAIYNYSGRLLDIKESVFENNIANYSGNGGAINNDGKLNVDKTNFRGNSSYCGTIYNCGIATLTDLLFKENVSSYYGAAIYISSGSGIGTVIDSCTFDNNYVKSFSNGGVVIDNNTSGYLIFKGNSTFKNN